MVCEPAATGGTTKIDRRRSIEGKKRKEEEKKIEVPRAVLARAPSPPTGRSHAVAALAHGRFFSRARRRNVSRARRRNVSRARRRNVSSHREKDRGD
ncbi:hypothetical protein GW17_00037589, partial [Ensete ventricosum]